MAAKFFGQFLVEREAVTSAQLARAVELQKASNLTLNQFAVHFGYLTTAQADKLVVAQRTEGKRFGELAVQEGLLTAAQIETLVLELGKHNIRLGEALVELGFIDTQELEREVSAFAAAQPAVVGELRMPDGSKPNPLLEAIVSVIQDMLLLLAGLHCKIDAPRVLDDGPASDLITRPFCFTGLLAADCWLTMSRNVAARVANPMATDDSDIEVDDELINDSVNELCDVISNSVVNKLKSTGLKIRRQQGAPPAPIKASDPGVLIPLYVPRGEVIVRVRTD